MITGFNTDIEHNGTIYHVQTEDKGLGSPLILSLIYVGGAILASKRSPYHDLIADGFDTQVLAERLQRQHKLLCAAISAGRIEDLKRMQQHAETRPRAVSVPPSVSSDETHLAARGQTDAQVLALPVNLLAETADAVSPEISASPVTEIEVAAVVHVEAEDALYLDMLEEHEFRAGEVVTIRVRVGRGPIEDRAAVQGAEVTVKILGSEFRPLSLRSKTDQDGVAVIHAWLPRFTAGRAAILIRAVADDCAAELRRIIQP